MDTIKWLKYNYPMSYEAAVNDGKNGTHRLYFDERCWTKADIHEFFEDLCYGDPTTYEKVIFKLPKRIVCHNKATKRYKQWVEEMKV